MDNQHRMITGYRELSEDEIASMNDVKRTECDLMVFIQEQFDIGNADPRWLAIARTDLQKAFMCLGRAIARPDGYPEPKERK